MRERSAALAAEYPGTMVVERKAVIETRFTTLAPPVMELAARAGRSRRGQPHGTFDVEVQRGAEAVRVPLVATVGEVRAQRC